MNMDGLVSELQKAFINSKNVEFILDKSIQNIVKSNTSIKLDKNDKEFFNDFNVIATTIFDAEKERQLHKFKGDILNTLKVLDNIVIDELTRYTLGKNKITITNEKIEEKLYEEKNTYGILNSKKFDNNIEGIDLIKLKTLCLYNDGDIINYRNNMLVYNIEGDNISHKITIPYKKYKSLHELIDEINKKCEYNNIIHFQIGEQNKVIVKSNIEDKVINFMSDETTRLLKFLGFNVFSFLKEHKSENVCRFKKSKIIDINVIITTNNNNTLLYKDTVFTKENEDYLEVNLDKDIKNIFTISKDSVISVICNDNYYHSSSISDCCLLMDIIVKKFV